jgi:hypothetical protein
MRADRVVIAHVRAQVPFRSRPLPAFSDDQEGEKLPAQFRPWLPRGIGIANLRDAPAEWSRQYERLGLTQS